MQVIPQGTFAQSLFNHGAASGKDKDVSKAIFEAINELLPTATNKPTGSDISAEISDHKADAKSALKDTQSLFTKQNAGSIALVLLGEDHNNDDDEQRGLDFLQAINQGNLNPSTVVFERGMAGKYNAPATGVPVVREDNLTTVGMNNFGLGLTASQRSRVIAGYLVLTIAGGNQNDIDSVLLFYGENHQDILTFFDYYARHTNASYLLKAPRYFTKVRSYQK